VRRRRELGVAPGHAVDEHPAGGTAPTCQTSQLQAALEMPDAGAGQRYVTLVLTNTGATCQLTGYVGLQLLAAGGAPIPTLVAPDTGTLVPVTLAPLPLGLLGGTYGVCAAGLDAWFVWHCVRVLRERTDSAARRMFHVSLVYLFALFLAMLVDLALR